MSRMLEMLATIVTLAGAFLTAQGNDPWNIYVMNVGSILWVIWSLYKHLWSIALVNLVMLSIYAYGIISRLATI